MADGGEGSAPMSDQELEQVRAERDELQGQVERMRAGRNRKLRVITAVVAIILAVVTFAGALPGAWARRTITNSDTFVSVVGPLASDPAVQEALSRQITAAVFTAVDVQAKLTEVLTEKAPQLVFLAGPITQSVQQFTQEQVQKILASGAFQEFWVQANRLVQSQLVAVLRGNSDVVQLQNGQVVLNYLPLINEALKAVSGTLEQLLGRQITLPEITADTVPAEAIQKLDAALGVTLPTTFGSVVVYSGDAISGVQDGIDIARKSLIGLVVVFLLAVGLALWVSPHRRRTLLQLATAIAVVTVIERRLAISSVNDVVNLVKPENQAAVRAVAEALVQWFLDYSVWFLVVALLTVLIAAVTGPYPWALWLRAAAADLARNTVHPDGSVPVGAPSAWVAAHRIPVMAAIGVVAVVVLWWADFSALWWLLFVLLVGVLEFTAWRVARGPTGEPAPA
jgi:hypothetical protein